MGGKSRGNENKKPLQKGDNNMMTFEKTNDEQWPNYIGLPHGRKEKENEVIKTRTAHNESPLFL